MINNENSSDRFKRLAGKRTNEIIKKLRILGNCSNRAVYSYTREDIDKIFSALDRKLKEVKAKFVFDEDGNDNFEL